MRCKLFLLLTFVFLFLNNTSLFSNDKKVISYYADSFFPPFEFIGDSGKIEGFNIDLMNAIMKEMGMSCTVDAKIWSDVLNDFSRNKVDIIAANDNLYNKSKGIRLTLPFFMMSQTLVSRDDNKIDSIEHLAGKILVVQDGTWVETYISNNYHNLNVIKVDNQIDGLRMLQTGKCDAIIDSEEVISYIISKKKLRDLYICKTELPSVNYCFAVKDKNSALISDINTAINNLKLDGTYDTIYNKWFGFLNQYTIAKKMIYIVSILLFCGFILLIFVILLRYKVKNSTYKLMVSEIEQKRINSQLILAINAGNLIPIVWDMNNDTVDATLSDQSIVGNIDLHNKELHFENYIKNIHPDYVEKLCKLREEMINGTIKNIKEEILYNTEGKYDKYYDIYLSIDQTDKKNAHIAVGYIQEITERKLSQIKMAKGRQFITDILDAIPFPVYVKDVANGGEYKYWNKQAHLLYGDMMTSEYSSEMDSKDNEIYDSENVYIGNETFTTSDGVEHHTIVKKSILYIGEDKLLICVRWNIEEVLDLQKEVQIAIKNNELILNHINAGLVYMSKDFIVQWENLSNFCSCDLLKGRYISGQECRHNIYADQNTMEYILEKTKKDKMTYTIEIESCANKVLEIVSIPILQDGELDGIILRADDVTEKKAILVELENAKFEAEEADRLKSAFLANMSHEIRTPLNSIVGFSNLMKDALTKEEKENYSNIISSNSESLLRLINDILDLSKIEAGFVEVNKSEFDLSKLFLSLNTSFLARMKGSVNFECHIPYLSCIINTDRNRLTQVVTNFVNNSIKFTSAGKITLGYELVEEGIKISVTDTGIGIASNNKHKVFGRFERFNEFSPGTGLGLSICKSIMDSLKGKIGFDSKLGKGSTFWAIFPTTVSTT